MFRRLASLGQQRAAENPRDPMPSSSAGDEPQASETKSSGLAGVFRGLTGSKLTKAPPPQALSTPSPAPIFPDQTDDVAPTQTALPQVHREAIDKLRNGGPKDRIAAAGVLRHAIPEFALNPVLDIFQAGKDMVEPENSTEMRHAGWQLLSACVKYTFASGKDRGQFFQAITTHVHPQDFHLQLAALEDLTQHGRDVIPFQYEIFPVLSAWLDEAYDIVKAARKEASKNGKKSSAEKGMLGEEQNLKTLFKFVSDVVKFNFKYATEAEVASVIDALLKICMSTGVRTDLRNCVSAIDAIITYGSIPEDRLRKTVLVLGSIMNLVPEVSKESWHTLSTIMKSHHGQHTMMIFLETLRSPPPSSTADGTLEAEKEYSREARSALASLRKMLTKSAEKGYPRIPAAVLADGLAVSAQTSAYFVWIDILKLINSLVATGDNGKVNPLIQDEDWTVFLDVAAECAEKAGRATRDLDAPPPSIHSEEAKAEDKRDDTVSLQLQYLVNQLHGLVKNASTDFLQKDDCVIFFTKVRQALPDRTVDLVLDHFKKYGSCYPSDTDWEQNLRLVVEAFYQNRSRGTLTRIHALETIASVYEFLQQLEDVVEPHFLPELTRRLLPTIGEEYDTLVLQETVAFLASVGEKASTELFDDILDAFKQVIQKDRLNAPISSPMSQASLSPRSADDTPFVPTQSSSNVVTRGMVQLFMRCMDTYVLKSQKIFEALVHIARSNACETDARLSAMKMLFRLRADWANRVYLVSNTESDGLAATLYRTEASLARKLAEEAAQPQRPSRAEATGARVSRGISFTQNQPERGGPTRIQTGPKFAASKYQRLWSLPDSEALPEQPSREVSLLLYSHAGEVVGLDNVKTERFCLPLATWLEALVALFHQGCDWEIYSFILVHLPSQLGNHAIFKNAQKEVQNLRRMICDMIRLNSFQEPPSMSGLRRPDVANCLFHVLTTVISYHESFQKPDEDEMVKAFTQGIADRTAKTCIHALSVCCHELPMSVSKSLVSILHKMSQVITQPLVAMHILEFLAGLSRLPNLYSNFREDEYRIVFGISFQYLKYVRDKKRSTRSAHNSEPPTPAAMMPSQQLEPWALTSTRDDLPQYVYALAYHVITFWFLALKVPDRAAQSGWIMQYLFTDVDGSALHEDQAIVTLDFMQRVAFSDVNDSTEDPQFTEAKLGPIAVTRWLQGNSILTIKHARDHRYSEVTRRNPSGVSSWLIREQHAAMPIHQTRTGPDPTWQPQWGYMTAPSHALVQLISGTPQPLDPNVRPVRLPDDDAVAMAVRSLDRIPTLDGHKVGVVYIGEKQSKETEILANTSGSPYYLNFLSGLGQLIRLKGATFNTQGLDREHDSDGEYTVAWRDRVTEVVFHVTTEMPTNLEHDAQCINKKRHIGNDFVNIIWNESGLPFDFNTFPSEFNYVNIVVSPASRSTFAVLREQAKKRDDDEMEGGVAQPWGPFFKVQVMSKPGFPEISPAADPKLISLRALPTFVRLLALNASVFSRAWKERASDEHVSSWRARLQAIRRLRERYGSRPTAPSPSPPPTGTGGGVVGGNSTLVTTNIAIPNQLGQQQQQSQAQQSQQQQSDSRPTTSSVRDSFNSLRRSSVATFFTQASVDATAGVSHRSSVMSTADNADFSSGGGPFASSETLVDTVDFSRWA